MTVFQSAEYDELLGFPLPRRRGSFVTSNSYFMSSKRPYGRAAALLAFALFLPVSALAQSTGTRAAGMGEAFVAVADDATSIYWNPAGMATGAYLSFVLDYGQNRAEPPSPDGTPGGCGGSQHFIGFTLPPFGPWLLPAVDGRDHPPHP